MRIRSALLPAVLAVSILVPAAARAQAPSPRAEALRTSAETLFEKPARYRHAADLLVRSARLREDTDPEKVRSLVRAARLYDYSGDYGRAASTAVNAGRLALQNGELVSAGHAWIDAALLQLKRNRKDEARALVVSAERLASSPHLSSTDRRELIERIAGSMGGN